MVKNFTLIIMVWPVFKYFEVKRVKSKIFTSMGANTMGESHACSGVMDLNLTNSDQWSVLLIMHRF